jgi:homoserine O-acetyltransferase/O-succinyltransferase
MEAHLFNTQTLILKEFLLPNGVAVLNTEIRYTVYGDLHNKKKTAVFFHGFSSNSELHTWWTDFAFDEILKNYHIICFNALGSCHGSLGPHSVNPQTGKPFLNKFPAIQIQDLTDFTIAGLDALQLAKVDVVFGCSLGGAQVLDMAIRYPQRATKFISACGSPLSLMSSFMNMAQCQMIESAIKSQLSEEKLKERMSFARFFFRLSCTSEKALNKLLKQFKNKKEAEKSFTMDRLLYMDEFSPYSYVLYMRMLANFQIDYVTHIDEKPRDLLLILMEGDVLTPKQSIHMVFNKLTNKGYPVRKKLFKTTFGHEAWILDGKRFYEFIKDEFTV